MSDDYEEVIASYYRCEDSGGFFDTFYEVFFAKSPEIPPKFANTDMVMQKQVVMAALLWVLRLYKGDPIARREVEKLSESHSRGGHDIHPGLYEFWLDALCESVEKHDREYTPELEARWRSVMRAGIQLMTSKH
jgi:hemoglobin-like flavoprotein